MTDPGFSHGGVLNVSTTLPLARRFGHRWLHLVEPDLAVRGTLANRALATPEGVVFGQRAEVLAGLRTELWDVRSGQAPRARGSAWLGAMLPVSSSDPLLLGGRARLGGAPGHGRIAAMWAPRQGRLATLIGLLCSGSGAGPVRRLCAGYSRLRLERIGELTGSWTGSSIGSETSGGGMLLPLALASDQVHGSAALAAGPVRISGTTAWDPVRGEHAYSSLGVRFSLGCGCYHLGLLAAARRGQRLPDLSLSLDLAGGKDPRCWP